VHESAALSSAFFLMRMVRRGVLMAESAKESRSYRDPTTAALLRFLAR
jgi:hypothetical protein